jgi:hypothetical protein
MKWLRTLVLFDQGGVMDSTDWSNVHESYVRSIRRIDHPVGSGSLTLRRKEQRTKDQWTRNGVPYLRTRFLQHMLRDEGWHAEGIMTLAPDRRQPTIKLYPSKEDHREPVSSEFGGFDFVTKTDSGTRVAIEWETGNISSSHRSMNKLAIALANDVIQVGVLIVPSRPLYEHLTDRIGNINELSGYLGMWEKLKVGVNRGLLAITVVEHDHLTSDPTASYLPVGRDGRSAEGLAK